MISNTAFGIDADTQNQTENNPFLDNAYTMVEGIEAKSSSKLEQARIAALFALVCE